MPSRRAGSRRTLPLAGGPRSISDAASEISVRSSGSGSTTRQARLHRPMAQSSRSRTPCSHWRDVRRPGTWDESLFSPARDSTAACESQRAKAFPTRAQLCAHGSISVQWLAFAFGSVGRHSSISEAVYFLRPYKIECSCLPTSRCTAFRRWVVAAKSRWGSRFGDQGAICVHSTVGEQRPRLDLPRGSARGSTVIRRGIEPTPAPGNPQEL